MGADVAGVKQGFLPASNEDAGGTERVSGVEKLQRGRRFASDCSVKRRPLDLPVVAVALKYWCQLVDFTVGEQRVLGDAKLGGLVFHHVDRVVQHALDDEVAQLAHHHVGAGKMPERDRERADVVVMAVGDGDGVDRSLADGVVERQGVAPLALGVGAGVHQQAAPVDLDVPSAGADARPGIEVAKFQGR